MILSIDSIQVGFVFTHQSHRTSVCKVVSRSSCRRNISRHILAGGRHMTLICNAFQVHSQRRMHPMMTSGPSDRRLVLKKTTKYGRKVLVSKKCFVFSKL